MKGYTKSIIFSVLTAACIQSFGHASSVVQLTFDNFDEFMSKHDLVLTEFFVPWCDYCKDLQHEYGTAATALEGKNATLAKVDCEAQPRLCKEHHIMIYPTLQVFRGLDNVQSYSGPRKAANIISYMKKQSLPVLSDVNKDNIQAFKSANKVVVIAFDQGTCIDNEWKHTFTSVAHSLRNEDSLLFGFTDDPELATTEGLTRGAGIVLYKQSDGDKIVYSGKLDKETVESFINQASLPLLDEVDKYLVEGYAKAGLPLALFFAKMPEERSQLGKQFKPLAERYKSKISIATADMDFANWIGFKVSKERAFEIRDLKSGYRISLDENKELIEEEVAQIIETFLTDRKEHESDGIADIHDEL